MAVVWDVIVVGAGAAGLLAAARSAAAGATTLLLEKNRKAGVKILMSGGTRCNLTHDCGVAGIIEAFGKSGRFLRQALGVFGPTETVAMFRSLGVATKVEATGKVFPASDRAVEVRDALLRQALGAGAELYLGCAVRGLRRETGDFEAGEFLVQTETGGLRGRCLIITVGGKSWPGCGTIGEGYGWMEQLGHTIVPPRPALVPLVGGEGWSRELSGLTLERVTTRVWTPMGEGTGFRFAKRPTQERTGGFLFTHFGYSGPVIMDVSRGVTAWGAAKEVRVQCDFVPGVSEVALTDEVQRRRQVGGGQLVGQVMQQWLPKRLAEGLSQQLGIAAKPLAELSRVDQQRLLMGLKRCPLAVTGTRGFEKAEVTAGGVSLAEVDPRTMESRLVSGLYIAGEILDLDGWIGGYNFQSAFSTGYVAGESAAAAARQRREGD